MTRPVQWSRDALDDLRDQISYIAERNPAAAQRIADRIRATCAALGEMATGRPGRVPGTYEKSVARLPHIIAYALTPKGGGEFLSIFRVVRTARNWPDDEWPRP